MDRGRVTDLPTDIRQVSVNRVTLGIILSTAVLAGSISWSSSRLVSRLDDTVGQAIKARALDANSQGVARQDELRRTADDEGYLEAQLWSGIGRARSGCGSAIVGDPAQVLAKLERYMDLGIRAFILSGYPLRDECEHFARLVLPKLETFRLADVHGRRPQDTPATPLTTAPRT